jgi:hypothetical protein
VRSVPRSNCHYERVLTWQLEEYEVGVRWPPACGDVRNVHCWKTLPSNAVNSVNENTSVCVTVICKM